MATVVLLTISNVFMTIAWYGHLRYKHWALWAVILTSWLIAFVEYCFQVPANRIGHAQFSAPQLKGIQEIISLAVFWAFSLMYLRESPTGKQVLGFVLIVAAAFFILHDRPARGPTLPSEGPRAGAGAPRVQAAQENRPGNEPPRRLVR